MTIVDEDGNICICLMPKHMCLGFSMRCYWCGLLPKSDKPHGLDRLNQFLCYVIGNVVPSCMRCNLMRMRPELCGGDFLQVEFLSHLEKVISAAAEHHPDELKQARAAAQMANKGTVSLEEMMTEE